jgi:hypothetical protein
MDWSFGTFLWSMVAFFVWFALIWMFITTFADILRRDMSGWAKVGWITLIALLPLVGILIYLIARPPSADWEGQVFPVERDMRYEPRQYLPADEIAKAARLRDEGEITPDEYEYLKQQALHLAY